MYKKKQNRTLNAKKHASEMQPSIDTLVNDTDISNEELGRIVRELHSKDDNLASDSDTVSNKLTKKTPLDTFDMFGDIFGPNGVFENAFANAGVQVNTQSTNSSNSTNEVTNNFTYTKRLYNNTSYDTNGLKKSESISCVKKNVNGQTQTYQKRTIEDEHGITTEEIRPDGQKVISNIPRRSKKMLK